MTEGVVKLKPCPFCGGKAKIYATTTRTYPNHAKHYCYCEKCLASGQSFSDYENDGSSVFKAIEAWNRRKMHNPNCKHNKYCPNDCPCDYFELAEIEADIETDTTDTDANQPENKDAESWVLSDEKSTAKN